MQQLLQFRRSHFRKIVLLGHLVLSVSGISGITYLFISCAVGRFFCLLSSVYGFDRRCSVFRRFWFDFVVCVLEHVY